MTDTPTNDELIPLFIPTLSAILMAAEEKKGAPLTEEEVLNIRDNSTTIMTPKSMIDKMAEKRGYHDIDPENCWNEWLLLRQKEGLETDTNGGAIVLDNPSDNSDMRKAEDTARDTLDKFKQLIKKHSDINSLIKVRIEDTETAARMWLIVDSIEENSFKAHLFEVPSDFKEHKAGDSFTIKNDEILDWMFNNNGDVYGAYTIRVQRQSMTEKEKKEMDEYMGINQYL